MPQSVSRNFNVSDPEMLAGAETTQKHYQTYQADFAALDPNLSSEFDSGFSADIAAARAVDPDDVEVKHQAIEGENFKAARKKCAETAKKIGYFVNTIFTSKAKQDQFLLSKVNDANSSPDVFVSCMTTFAHTVAVNRQLFLDAGCSAELLDSLPALVASLSQNRTGHMEAKHTRNIHTSDRITLMNNVWARLEKLKDAAESVFVGKPELEKLFALPSHPKNHKPNSDGTDSSTNSDKGTSGTASGTGGETTK